MVNSLVPLKQFIQNISWIHMASWLSLQCLPPKMGKGEESSYTADKVQLSTIAIGAVFLECFNFAEFSILSCFGFFHFETLSTCIVSVSQDVIVGFHNPGFHSKGTFCVVS